MTGRFPAGCSRNQREKPCLNCTFPKPPALPRFARLDAGASRSTCGRGSTRPTASPDCRNGTAKPLTFLFAFQQAEPYLGLPPHAFKLVSWLVGLTSPQDWEEGSRPIASPSAAASGGISRRVVAAAREDAQPRATGSRDLRDARHPQGRRFCRRDKNDRIIEAYGFDLSLLAMRYDEFVRIAANAKAERERMRKLRRLTTLARRAIMQAAEELGAQGHDSEPVAPFDAGGGRAGEGRPAMHPLRRAGPCFEGTGAAQGRGRANGSGTHQACGNRPQGATKLAPQYILQPYLLII